MTGTECAAPLEREDRFKLRLTRLQVMLRQQAVLEAQVRLEINALTLEDTAFGLRQYVGGELALAFNESPSTADRWIDRAQVFASYPSVSAKVSDGTWTIRQADAVLEEVTGLMAADQMTVVEMVINRSKARTPYELRKAARAMVMLLDLDAAQKRAEKAKDGRSVLTHEESDGSATLLANGPKAAIAAISACLDAMALPKVPGDTRTLGQRRFDTLMDLVCGRITPGTWEAFVLVSLSTLEGTSDAPAEIPGLGLITAGEAREIIAQAGLRRVVVNEDGTLHSVDSDSAVISPDLSGVELAPMPLESDEVEPDLHEDACDGLCEDDQAVSAEDRAFAMQVHDEADGQNDHAAAPADDAAPAEAVVAPLRMLAALCEEFEAQFAGEFTGLDTVVRHQDQNLDQARNDRSRARELALVGSGMTVRHLSVSDLRGSVSDLRGSVSDLRGRALEQGRGEEGPDEQGPQKGPGEDPPDKGGPPSGGGGDGGPRDPAPHGPGPSPAAAPTPAPEPAPAPKLPDPQDPPTFSDVEWAQEDPLLNAERQAAHERISQLLPASARRTQQLDSRPAVTAGPDASPASPAWSLAGLLKAVGIFRTRDAEPPPSPSKGYLFTGRLARHIKTRDQTCCFPGCPRRAQLCQTDHVVEHPNGPTSLENGASECVHHHQAKHHYFTVTRFDNGTIRWTGRSGIYADRPPRPLLTSW